MRQLDHPKAACSPCDSQARQCWESCGRRSRLTKQRSRFSIWTETYALIELDPSWRHPEPLGRLTQSQIVVVQSTRALMRELLPLGGMGTPARRVSLDGDAVKAPLMASSVHLALNGSARDHSQLSRILSRQLPAGKAAAGSLPAIAYCTTANIRHVRRPPPSLCSGKRSMVAPHRILSFAAHHGHDAWTLRRTKEAMRRRCAHQRDATAPPTVARKVFMALLHPSRRDLVGREGGLAWPGCCTRNQFAFGR